MSGGVSGGVTSGRLEVVLGHDLIGLIGLEIIDSPLETRIQKGERPEGKE